MNDDFDVRFSESDGRGRWALVVRGEERGEMTFSRTTPELVIVDHTLTDPALQGQGAGKRLFHAMVAWARATGTKVMATCPFALAMFERFPDAADVRA
ncbi:MAG: GNAT family N-acetyltransferase [Myxococcota bacterium]